MTIILTAQSIREAEAVARHLHASLTSVLQSPPVQGHRAATLSSELGVGRMTCQRIMKLAKTSADPGPELLAELPGVGGLREFLEAVIRAGVPRSSRRGFSRRTNPNFPPLPSPPAPRPLDYA